MNQISEWIKSHPKESVGALLVGLGVLWFLLKKSAGGNSSAVTPAGAFGTGLSGSQYLQLAALNSQGLAQQNQNQLQLTQLADSTAIAHETLANQLQLGTMQIGSQQTIAEDTLGAQLQLNQQNNDLATIAITSQADVQREALAVQQSAQDAASQFALASVNANRSGRTASGVASIVASLENPAVGPGVVAANQPYEVASNFQTSSILNSIGNIARGFFGSGGISGFFNSPSSANRGGGTSQLSYPQGVYV